MHGVPQLASTSSPARRVAYVIVVLSSLAFLVFHLSASVIEFRRFDSYVNTQTELRDDVIMPSVTICSYALHTRSAFARHFPNISQDLFVDTYSFPVLFYVAPTSNDTSGLLEYHLASSTLLFSELRPQLDDVFIHCVFQQQQVRCADYVIPFLTNFGLCYTFHSLNFTRHNGLLRANHALSGSAFFAILDANPDDFLYNAHRGSGFQVQLHDVDEFPEMAGDSLHVGVGQTAHIVFRKEIHHVLPKP